MSYGEHILSTGLGNAGELELLLGRHFYEEYFRGLSPILDLGAGRCWFTKQNPKSVWAVDLAPEIVRHYAAQGLRISAGSAYDIPFPAGFFAGVFCCWLLEHVADVDRAMGEIERVLQPGGKCVIIVPSDRLAGFWDDYTHVRPFTRASLRQLARSNGFVAITIRDFPYVRGASFLLRWVNRRCAWRWIRFSHRYLRRIGITNRGNLELECLRQ